MIYNIMSKPTVLIIDGYIDDPAALGVPPYISPIVRATAGAALDAGADVIYFTIDKIRKKEKIPKVDVSVVISGNTVPGKYIRSMPMSVKELDEIFNQLSGWRWISGSATTTETAKKFDFVIEKDIAASLYDGIVGKEITERYRTLEEWNRWMQLGAEIVKQHQDYPFPLVVEIETYRGCHRYKTGGCSFCIEPLKGKPLMRDIDDIVSEAKILKSFGIRNIRLGGQTCIVSYGSEDYSNPPKPNPDKVIELFESIKELNFDVVHTDNANPAVIAEYPVESEKILKCIADCCTDGNVVALGMESTDPDVIKLNNLNSTPEQVFKAVEIINKVGSERGKNGMPQLLPGINIICGLNGENKKTNEKNLKFLQEIVDKNLMIRRINIRQVLPIRNEFDVKINQKDFKKFKEDVRNSVDNKNLKNILPKGTILRNVFMEIHDGNTTFGRQIGSYPLLVGIPYKLELEKCYDIVILDWGMRSVTGIEAEFRINEAKLSQLEGLPGIGKKRATKLFMAMPIENIDEFRKIVDDDRVVDNLKNYIKF